MQLYRTHSMALVSETLPITVNSCYAADESGRNIGVLIQVFAATPFDLEVWRQYSAAREVLMFRSRLPRRSFNLTFPRPLYDPEQRSGRNFVVYAHRFGKWEGLTLTEFGSTDFEQNRGMAAPIQPLGMGVLWPWRYYWGDACPSPKVGDTSTRPWSSVPSAIIKIAPPALVVWRTYSGTVARLPAFPVTPSSEWQTLRSSVRAAFATPPLNSTEATTLQSLAISADTVTVEMAGTAGSAPARLLDMSISSTLGEENVYNLTFEYGFC